MMLLKGQAVLPLFLLVWLSGINFLTGDEGSLEAMIDHSSPTVEKFSNKRDSLISPVLPSDEVVTILGFESDDKDGSGDLLYQDFDVLDVDEINVPMKQNELNISMASPDMMVVKAINYNKKALVELSDFVVNTDVPHGADLEDSELLQDREDHDSEHSGAWSPALVALVKGIPSEQVCHEVAVFPYESSCSWMSMSAQFFGSPADLKVRLNSSLVQVIRIAHQCKYKMEKRTGFFIFTAYNDGCNVQKIRGCHVLTLLWQNEKVSLACPAGDVSVGLPPAVLCNDTSMTVGLPSVSPDDLKVKDHLHWVPAHRIAKRCKYEFLKDAFGRIFFTASYKGCYIKREGSYYILTMRYTSPNHKENVLAMRCPIHYGEHVTTPHSTVPPVSRPKVSCHASTMDVLLPGAVPDQVKVKDKKHQEVAVQPLAERCHYLLRRRGHDLMFTASYKSCHVHMENHYYTLTVVYKPTVGPQVVITMKCLVRWHPPLPLSTPMKPSTPKPVHIVCGASSMSLELPGGLLGQVKVLDKSHHPVVVLNAPKKCQYHLVKRGKTIVFTAGYTSCHVYTEHSRYVVVVLYTSENGVQEQVTMKCPIHAVPTSSPATSSPPLLYSTTCKVSSMTLTLPGGSFNQVNIMDKSNRMVAVVELPRHCGYSLLKAGGHLLFTVEYKACDVRMQDHHYTLTVIYLSAAGDRIVQMKCPVQQASTALPTTAVHPHYSCMASGMTVVLPYGSLDQVKIVGNLGQEIVASKAPKHCGYKLVKGKGTITFSASYTACDIQVENHHYILHMSYKPAIGNPMTVTLSCPLGGDPFKTTTPATSTRKPSFPIECKTSSMAVALPAVSPNDVQVVDQSGHPVHVISAPKTCGYTLEMKGKMLVLTALYKACHVSIQHAHYVLEVLYKSGRDKRQSVTMKCPVPRIPPPTISTSTHYPPLVSCKPSSMSVVLPVEFPEQVLILGLHGDEKVLSFKPKECGYTVVKSMGKITLTALYTSCGVHKEENFFVLNLRFYPIVGHPVAVQMKCPAIHVHPTPPRTSPTVSADPRVVCQPTSMTVELPKGKLEDIKLIDKMGRMVAVQQAPKKCGYHLAEAKKISFLIPYKACDVKIMDHHYTLAVAYTPTSGGQRKVIVKCPVIGKPPSPLEAGVSCDEDCMSIDLPTGPLDQVKVVDEYHNAVTVKQSVHCGYNLSSGVGKLHFSAFYKACHVKIQNGHHVLTVLYTTSVGTHGEVQLKCPVHDLVFHQGCDLPRKKQVQCGPSGIYPNVCRSKGCCVDPKTSHCFYPMDTCTSDGHFVFAVYRTSSKPDVDPGSLYVSDHSCAPVICTPDFAVFKIPLTGCGTHRFVIGETSIYLADVFGKRYKNHQIYGQILRHTPYHSQIECRYSKGTHASAGYMVVNSPALPDVVSSGELGIVLRIAKDDGYATFFPDTQVPLRYLLGSKIYLEVKIVNPPTPEVVLLVHYCIAYPRSSENVWVLMYNGCPNALDYGTGLHLKDHNWQPVPKHTRRFDVTTFQFMDAKENLLDEEIYFMCSTEICSHKESCVEGCFDGRQMAVPQSEWGRLCAGKPCPRQLRVERAIADHGSLLQRDVPSTLENGNFLN
ncbi:ZP4 protein, partial [Polypterus senegalus]|nr:ZP4 protein [Polypterus senegalus]